MDTVTFSVSLQRVFTFVLLQSLVFPFATFLNYVIPINLSICAPSDSLFSLLKSLLTLTCFLACVWPTIALVNEGWEEEL